MANKVLEWLFPPKKQREKIMKPLTKSQKMNEEHRQAFLRGRNIMKQHPTHRECMRRKGKAQTE